MLLFSFCLLLIAALVGSLLAALHLQAETARPGAMFGVLHGLLGAVGFAALLLALQGPARGAAMGVGSFGRVAATLLSVALLAGLLIVAMRLLARPIPGLVIGIHATIAVSGIVILAAYTLVG
jgi:hypothetical protein